MTGSVAAAAQLSHRGISAGPVVAIVGIVAAVAIILVLAVSYILHQRALNAGRIVSPATARWATQAGSNPSFSAEPGKDEFSR